MSLQLPPGTFSAYLFDCDGTITDSMPLHYVAWKQALEQYACPFPEEVFYSFAGRPATEIIHSLNQQHGLRMPVQHVTDSKEHLFMQNIAQLRPVPEVLEHINLSHGKIPFAVVSGSPRASVELSLQTLGMLHLFETLVCAGEYTHGKPDPEPFLLAAQRLGVAPAACLVFEDGDLGIDSARNAGMAWVKVDQPHQRSVA